MSLRRRSVLAVLAFEASAACGQPPARREAAHPAPEGTARAPAPLVQASATPSVTETPRVTETRNTAEARNAAEAPASFPPADTDSHDESAMPGDGHWTPFGDAALHELAAGSPPLIVKTVVHPHPKSRFITVTVAAVDLSRVSLGFVPGTEDLLWAHLPVDGSSGLVPKERRSELVAVMNGGFQPKHGHFGMIANKTVVAPPRPDGCTLGIRADGGVRLASFPELSAEASDFSVLRQTPACLLEHGELHPDLAKGRDKRWAGHAADLTTRRRSAVGIDRSGGTLFYAIGEEADPRELAEALKRVGAVTAAEFDINWYWTRFLLFGATSRTLEITSSLIPKMEHQASSYVERPSTRDFFYFVRK